jgi:outer membrane protein OmpA-like peptidoglycan-associated protein
MNSTLLKSVSGLFNDDMVGLLANVIGEKKSAIPSALSSFIPAILRGIIHKGESVSGAGSLLDLIKEGSYGENTLNNMGDLLGGGNKTTSLIEAGGKLLSSVFGDKQNFLLDTLTDLIGFKRSGTSSLLGLLTPFIFGQLGKLVNRNKLDASGLREYLQSEKDDVVAALPANLSKGLGFATAAAPFKIKSENDRDTAAATGGNGWWKWLLLALLGLVLIWFLTQKGCGAKDTEGSHSLNDTEMTSGDDKDAKEADHDTKKMDGIDANVATKFNINDNGDIVNEAGSVIYKAGTFFVDAGGNIIDGAGNILIKVGQLPASAINKLKAMDKDVKTVLDPNTIFTIDADGNIVDADGKILYKATDYKIENGYYVDKDGNKIARILGKVKEAIVNAAEKTADAFSDLFSKMIKKEANATTNYTLSKLEFNPESHRITSFSKAEVEGLAAALKANPDGKIVVSGYTNDGKNDKENMSLSKIRAEVVHDMLVTLGVDKNQISFKGLGTEDAARAAADMVVISAE